MENKEEIMKRIAALSPAKRAAFEKMLRKEKEAVNLDEENLEDSASPQFMPAEYEEFLTANAWQTSDIEDMYFLSPMQEGLLFHSLREPESPMHCEQASYHISGDFDPEIFAESWRELSRRHAILRTAFVHKNLLRPLQIVLRKREIPVSRQSLAGLSESEQQQYIEQYLRHDKEKVFDLTHGDLTRVAIFYLAENSYHVIWAYHSILLDAWSIGVLFRELTQIYEKLRLDREPDLPRTPRFRDYIRWIGRQNAEASKAWWSDYLSGYSELAGLPVYGAKPESQGYDLKEWSFTLTSETSDALQTLARTFGVTLNTVFQLIWGILLSRYNDTQDAVYGVIVSGRPSVLKGMEEMVGLFINAVPVRIRTERDQAFSEALKAVQKQALESERHQYLSLAEIQAERSEMRELSDHLLLFENFPSYQELMKAGSFAVDQVKGYEQFSHYNFNIVIFPDKDIRILFSYNGNVYPEEQMAQLTSHLRTLIDSVLENPERPVGSITILPEAERNRVLYDFNDTAADYPHDKTIVEIFEEQVEKTPDNIAVIFEDTRLTYRELNEKANQLAHFLRSNCGIQPDDRIGLYLERSEWMIVGVFGILKAGGAYLPVNPEYPESRIQYMLSNSECSVLLTEEKFMEKASATGLSHVFDVRQVAGDRLQVAGDRGQATGDTEQVTCNLQPATCNLQPATCNLQPVAGPRNLAYVIYTSGSTGQPKGVMIEHHSVLNRILWMHKRYPLLQDGVILQKTPFTFDVSVWELFWWSFAGAAVCMLKPGGEKDPAEIVNAVEKYRITTMHFVPSMFNIFLNHIEEQDCASRLSSLKHVFASGEALTAHQVRRFNSLVYEHHGAELINFYGPTEATVDVSYFDCSPFAGKDVVPIGKPIDNTQLYILDQHNAPLPVGIPGELCIAGVNVGRGYLNKPELTAEKFVPDPFFRPSPLTPRPSPPKMYRTGDLCRWLPDGNIEYLGRNDFQVKIRGFRIELGEIENRLLGYMSVRDALVTAIEVNNDKALVAYIASKEELSVNAIRDYLKAGLPEYMVPSYFVHLEKFPLNSSGKTDRKALPDPFSAGMGPETEYLAPRDEIEEKLAAIWQEILKSERVGMRDNFFEMGGHSLKATQVVSRIHKELGIELPLPEVFNKPTIEKLAEHIRNAQPVHYESIEAIEGIAPASDEELAALKSLLGEEE